MKVSGKQFVLEAFNTSKVKQAMINADSRTMLFHCTDFNAAKNILSSKEFRFSRIDWQNLNDQEEAKKFAGDLCGLFFLACFSYDDNSKKTILERYSKGKEGIAIKFELEYPPFKKFFIDYNRKVRATYYDKIYKEEKKLYWLNLYPKNVIERNIEVTSLNYDWVVEINQRDVIYDEAEWDKNPIKFRNEKYGHVYNLTAMGAIKNKEWNNERESRLTAVLRTVKDNIEIPDISFLYVPITFDFLKNINITFCSDIVKDRKKEIIQEFDRILINVPHSYN